MSLQEFAQQLGATYVAREYYPPDSNRSYDVFAIRFFDKHKGELGYWLVDLKYGHAFATPRQWPESSRRYLHWVHPEILFTFDTKEQDNGTPT